MYHVTFSRNNGVADSPSSTEFFDLVSKMVDIYTIFFIFSLYKLFEEQHPMVSIHSTIDPKFLPTIGMVFCFYIVIFAHEDRIVGYGVREL